MPSTSIDRKFPRRVAFALSIAVLLDCAALWSVFSLPVITPAQALPAMGLHLAAAGLMTAVAVAAKKQANVRYLAGLSALLTFFTPVVGPAGCLVSYVAGRVLIKPRGLAKAFSGAEGGVVQGEEEFSGLWEDVKLHEELSIQPVVDILEGEDAALKRGAIQLLRRLGTPDAVRTLKKSLSDSDAEVRFYAHTALTRLEEDYAERFTQVQKEARDDDLDGLIALAKIQQEYAASGLPDDSIQTQMLSEARSNLTKALKAPGGDQTKLRTVLGLLELRLGELESAKQEFETVLNAAPDTPDALLGLLNVCFNQKDAQALRRLRQNLQGKRFDTTDPAKLTVLNFWAGHLGRKRSHA